MVDRTGWSVRNKANPYFAKADHVKLAKDQITKPLIDFGGPPSALDPDAAAYISAVETADGEALESGVKTAINDFVVGCKADSIWAALKASCILAGARTLSGALVPLVGTAPTNVNFVSADYNRKTGFDGDGSTKYLDSNFAFSSANQNNNHILAYASDGVLAHGGETGAMAGSVATGNGAFVLAHYSPGFFTRNSSFNFDAFEVPQTPSSFGMSRNNASNYSTVSPLGTTTVTIVSQAPVTSNVLIFRRQDAVPTYYTRQLSFYSIGEGINLAALDARVSALMTALDGAIA